MSTSETIYKMNGFKNRAAYLDYLVLDFWVDLETIKKLALSFNDNDLEGMFIKLPELIEKELDCQRMYKAEY